MEEKLVLAVTGYPELYDLSDKKYSNKNAKQAAWSRVSFAVERPVTECQRKWKYLRDEYLKQRRLEKERRSGAEGGPRKRWKYMHILSFLEPHVRERETSSNFEASQPLADTDIEEECPSASASSSEATLPPPSPPLSLPPQPAPQSTNNRPSSKPRKRQADQEPLSEYQQRLLAAVSGADRSDEDEHFFLGLVPQMKRLPPMKRASTKMKIMQLMFEAEFEEA
ncbi:uncharacterized protein LOC134442106 [Engraulis encrasicolus]|uniref:uncharacterized protein LOC134442106 n=1 Tax=Engraulis encrasicolus TaxID=184585 RepID=UPI002FD204CA